MGTAMRKLKARCKYCFHKLTKIKRGTARLGKAVRFAVIMEVFYFHGVMGVCSAERETGWAGGRSPNGCFTDLWLPGTSLLYKAIA